MVHLFRQTLDSISVCDVQCYGKGFIDELLSIWSLAIIELTADRPSSADTKTKVVDCAVQVAVKTANKSVNARQEFANFRYDKTTQVTDDNDCLPAEEEAKIERDMKELGWITPRITNCVRKIIQAKVNVKYYASGGASSRTRLDKSARRRLAESHSEDAGMWEGGLLNAYYDTYHKDSKGMFTRMVEDEVIEVISDQELKDRHSACLNYTEEFMLCLDAKRTLTFL